MAGSLYPELLEKAIRLSARAHRKQMRKASDLPYLVHPLAVTLILAQAGYEQEPETLAAAMLHDVVEDTPVTLEELDQEYDFPPHVIKLVEELSEQKENLTGEKRPWKERKQHHIEVIRTSSESACAIVLADKLHNLKATLFDLAQQGTTVWDRFHAAPEEVLWYHREMLKAAERPTKRIAYLLSENHLLLNELAASLKES